MVDDTYGATIAKRWLSLRLRDLREASGYTANQVCDQLNWGRGKVGRFEQNSWVRPEMSDIRDLARFYQLEGGEERRFLDHAHRARGRAWWREYPDIFDNEFPGYENDAARICVYLPLVLPNLLQTAAYMEAQLRVGSRSSSWCNRAVGARLRRQDILDREHGTAPELVAVVTEAALSYQWGTVAERSAQIMHLVEMSRRSNVDLRVLRFADGPHPGMSSSMNVFDFPADEPSIVFLENDVSIQEVSKPEEVKVHNETFSRIQSAAMEPVGTTSFLKQLAESLE